MQRIREGCANKRLLREEANHALGQPERPRGMSKAAARIWDYLVETMDPQILRRADRDGLKGLCQNQALLDKAYQQLESMDLMLTTPEAKVVLNVIRDLSHRLNMERREFGLTPSARTRVEGSGNDAGNSRFDDALFNRSTKTVKIA